MAEVIAKLNEVFGEDTTEMVSPEKLDVLAEMLTRADLEEHAQLLEEVRIQDQQLDVSPFSRLG
jgi:hypothetical protein